MCRCCQSCWEDLYWNCIEERFCYDESIAHYDPDQDEYLTETKTGNGFLNVDSIENNNAPICRQPSRLQRNCSSVSAKIHEDDLKREIQTNVPMLAPEVLAVFANSQIFQDHCTSKSIKSPPVVKFAIDSVPITTTDKSSREENSEKLLRRLEGPAPVHHFHPTRTSTVESSFVKPKPIPAIIEEEDSDEIVIRVSNKDLADTTDASTFQGSMGVTNKSMSTLQAAPYFSFRPASENDIFTISTNNHSTISQTPEVPAISFTNLPKNYLETPTIGEYMEAKSLHSIQTAGIRSEKDLSMPRYYRKSELFLQHSSENFGNRNTPSLTTSTSTSALTTTPKRPEHSKRLQNIRSALPPLLIVRGASSSSLKDLKGDKKRGRM